MFKDSNFDVLEFTPPFQGMNRNISKDILPNNFAYLFENLVPIPAGEARPRAGTFQSISEPLLETPYSIIKSFAFQKENGSQQTIFYLSYFKEYFGATEFTIIENDTFSFTPPNADADFIEKDTPIRIVYNPGTGEITQTTNIENVLHQNDGSIRIQLKVDLFRAPYPEILRFFTSKGRIVIFDEDDGAVIANQGIENLHTGVVPYSEVFMNKFLICNGVDPIFKWDGTTFEKVFDFVKEQADSFNRIDNTHFSFVATDAFLINKYPVGTKILISVDEQSTELTVVSIQQNPNNVTIETEENLPDFSGDSVVELFYIDYPPPFSFLKVINDRIFALGPGAVSLEFRKVEDCLRVYYMYETNSVTNWFNENTKTVPSINISSKHGVLDNLEAIAFFNGFTLFIGRIRTQVWSGQDPTDIQSENPFVFHSLLPVGIFHGSLLNELANDIYFVSFNGMMSFGTLNVAKQFAATSIDAVDPLIKEYIQSALKDNQTYRSCCSFNYNSGNFCGFKIGENPVLIGFCTTNIYGWGLFSGDFQLSRNFLININGTLSLLINDEVYTYGDEISSTSRYNGDRDDQKSINFIWSFPTTRGKKVFCNKFYEFNFSYSSTFALSKDNDISILISGDMPENFILEGNYETQITGDVLGTIPLLLDSEDLNNPEPTDIGLRFNIPYKRKFERLKFISSDFYVTIFGKVINGTLSIKKLRLFGSIER